MNDARTIPHPSDAILAGCQIAPWQCRHQYCEDDGRGHVVEACAMGAMFLGMGGDYFATSMLWIDLKKAYPELDSIMVVNPARPENSRLFTIAVVIMQLNDDDDWSREQIAEWLRETLADRSDRVLCLAQPDVDLAGIQTPVDRASID